ncbi:efflux RND transporter permease subunit [Cytophaga aurantiaca]|uniref:efflux RND transporter permease subunit n=1 Tax=Cytophaga aurantiaca TaxID=29530 RepID=UPI00037A2BB3|nr:efflux RND transporter permease subunit [Cytophaga aurantiaca]
MESKSYFQILSKPILLVGVMLLIGGIFSYTRMQTALFPEVSFPKITLIVDNGQQPIDRMMITVTKPLESAVRRVKGVSVVKSSTSRGSCVIEVYFKWDEVDIYTAKLQMESRINEIKNMLPPGVNISVEAMNQSLFPVYGYTLESKNHSLIALKDNANLVVRPVFAQVDGISNVVVRGGKSKELVVIPDAVKMSSLGITPLALITVFNNNNFVQSNGYLSDYRRLYLTLTDIRVMDVDDLKNVVVKNDGSRTVTLKDIATIDIQEQQEFIVINANGNDAVVIDLVKQQGVNLIDFADNIEVKAEEVRKLLPPGIELKSYYNQSAFVGDSIHSVLKTIYEGLFLAIVVMIIFLRSFRASLVVTLTIPVTVAFTILILYLTGISINIMSLGAIAASIGLIIDDAIVIIEQIYRGHEEHPEKSKYTVVREAIKDLFPAMIGSSLATIVIHFPFRLMSGLAGSFFKELSDTMQITMICSFLVTWLLLPVLHLMIGYKAPKKAHHSNTGDTHKLAWLTWFFNKPAFASIFIAIIGFWAFTVFGKLETGFLPDLDEGTIVLDYYTPSGTSLEETDRILREVEKIIITNPDVESYSRRTGIRMAFKTVPANFGDYSIQLKKDRTHTTPEVIDELRKKIEVSQPSLAVSFGQRIADLLGDLMSSSNPIEIKIFGNDQKILEKLSVQAEAILKEIPGVEDINNGLVVAGPSVVFIPDQQKLAQFKISLVDFQNQLSAYTGGIPLGLNANVPMLSPAQMAMAGGIQVGQIQDGEQMRRILLRFTNFSDNSLEKIKSQLIFLPDGTVKPLSFFCEIKIIPGDIELKRENLKSDAILTARLNGRDLGSTISEIQEKFKAKLALPTGYSIVYGGAYAEQQASFHELMLILIGAILLVFAVLVFLFKEWLISILILFISVGGITGCILALYYTGIPLNVSSYTGIIMIVGIIAENAIFTVNQFFFNLKETGDVDRSINYAIALRIRPKLMTAIGAILALMPLALGIGLGAQMQQPLAVSVIGGFVVAMPLLLFVFPTMMRVIYYRKNKKVHE